MSAFLSGFSLGLSFILAIGAQNAYVLKQGLKRQHIFKVCLICALSDSVLIIVGISGQQVFVQLSPQIGVVLKYIGSGFLIVYGIKSFYNAFTTTQKTINQNMEMLPTSTTPTSSTTTTGSVILIALAFTWLNPHVYIDTLLIIGSLSLQYSSNLTAYTSGAILASYIFFFSLGYGARILTPLFKNPLSWKGLDIVIGIVMLSLGLSLLNTTL